MALKFLTPLLFLAAQFIITWYGYFLGKQPNQGSFLGFAYDSQVVSMLVLQLKFLWVPVIINFLYGIGFQWGNAGYQNFLIIISLWIAAGPIAAVLFNTLIVKEKIDLPIIMGMALIVIGAILVIAHKEIANALKL